VVRNQTPVNTPPYDLTDEVSRDRSGLDDFHVVQAELLYVEGAGPAVVKKHGRTA
jgi:hypothetical protein